MSVCDCENAKVCVCVSYTDGKSFWHTWHVFCSSTLRWFLWFWATLLVYLHNCFHWLYEKKPGDQLSQDLLVPDTLDEQVCVEHRWTIWRKTRSLFFACSEGYHVQHATCFFYHCNLTSSYRANGFTNIPEKITNDKNLARSLNLSSSNMLQSIQFIFVSFLSHPSMVTCRETILFVEVVVCLEHNLDALWGLLG